MVRMVITRNTPKIYKKKERIVNQSIDRWIDKKDKSIDCVVNFFLRKMRKKERERIMSEFFAFAIYIIIIIINVDKFDFFFCKIQINEIIIDDYIGSKKKVMIILIEKLLNN